MSSHRLVSIALVALVMAGGVLAAGLPARWRAAALPPISAEALGLDPASSAQLARLQSRQQAFRIAAYDTLGSLLNEARSELANPQPQLPALSADIDQALLALALEHRAMRAERMQFYESLDAGQQALVHERLRLRLDHLEQLHSSLAPWLAQAP